MSPNEPNHAALMSQSDMGKFEMGDEVYVPSLALPDPDGRPFALTLGRVTGQEGRLVRVSVPNNHESDVLVSTKLLHGRNLGITVFRIGDIDTEEHLLDPLAKSILHYLRLFLPHDAIRLREVRTSAEIQAVWEDLEATTSHVVIIGHGSETSIKLLDCEYPVDGATLGQIFENASPTTSPKMFVSLSCLTGRMPFARPFSLSKVCGDYLAPFQSVHSAAASLFAQSYFANHLLNGQGVRAAYGRAHQAVGRGVHFRHWRDGIHLPIP